MAGIEEFYFSTNLNVLPCVNTVRCGFIWIKEEIKTRILVSKYISEKNKFDMREMVNKY